MKTEILPIEPASTMERLFTVLVLLLMTGAFLNLGVTPGANADQAKGVLAMQAAWALIYFITFVYLFRYVEGFIGKFLQARFLALLLIIAVFSTAWSEAPSVTLRRSIALLCTSLFGLYFANRYDLREQLRLLSNACWVAIFGSFVFQLLGLGTAIEQHQGSWIGLFTHRNELGGIMCLSAVVFLCLGKALPTSVFEARAGFFLSCVLVMLSRSQGAFVSLMLLLVLWTLRKTLQFKRKHDFVLIALAGASFAGAIWWSFKNLAVVTQALGRNVTLSGRIYIWILSVTMALRKPWLGYGYSAFWLGSAGSSARIWKALNWAAPGAHNGLLQLILDLGLLGGLVFLGGFLVYTWRAFHLLRQASAPEIEWLFLFLAYLALWNLTESALMGTNTIFWALYSAVVFSVSDATRHFEEQPEFLDHLDSRNILVPDEPLDFFA